MGRTPKAELGAPALDGGELCPPRPFDDLLIPAPIQVGLVMVVSGKVHLNATLPDQVFERTPDKPVRVGRIMAEQQATARLATEGGVRGRDRADPDPGHDETGAK